MTGHAPAPKVIVQHLVTLDGEAGHPMNVAATLVEVDADGKPIQASLTRLVERVVRDITARAVRARADQIPRGEGDDV